MSLVFMVKDKRQIPQAQLRLNSGGDLKSNLGERDP